MKVCKCVIIWFSNLKLTLKDKDNIQVLKNDNVI